MDSFPFSNDQTTGEPTDLPEISETKFNNGFLPTDRDLYELKNAVSTIHQLNLREMQFNNCYREFLRIFIYFVFVLLHRSVVQKSKN